MSTKSLAEKLLIKPNTTLWSSHPSRLDLIQPLPGNLRPRGPSGAGNHRADLRRRRRLPA
jgi:hypothetical protein